MHINHATITSKKRQTLKTPTSRLPIGTHLLEWSGNRDQDCRPIVDQNNGLSPIRPSCDRVLSGPMIYKLGAIEFLIGAAPEASQWPNRGSTKFTICAVWACRLFRDNERFRFLCVSIVIKSRLMRRFRLSLVWCLSNMFGFRNRLEFVLLLCGGCVPWKDWEALILNMTDLHSNNVCAQ